MVVALQCLGLTVLHLNVTTTADHLAFYSLSLKVTNYRHCAGARLFDRLQLSSANRIFLSQYFKSNFSISQ
jgi:hypothetical protein